jgi:hypothetical protein
MAITALAAFAVQRYLLVSLQWPLFLILVYDIVATVDGLKRQGTLDVLGCTPATDRAIARAIIRVHFKRGLVLFPALAVTVVLSLFSPMAMLNLSFETVRDAAIATAILASGVLANLASLYLIAAIGSYVAAGTGGTAKRMVFAMLHYMLANFIVSIAAMMIIFLPLAMQRQMPANPVTPFDPLVAIGTSAVSAVVLVLYAIAYRNRLSSRLGKEWRNGGFNRVVVNPVGA